MKIRTILKGEELSKEPANPVLVIDGDIKDLALDMCVTMTQHKAIGLAAPQIGVLLQIIVINGCTFAAQPNSTSCTIMINPEVIASYDSQEIVEGCLSFPGDKRCVTRKKTITVQWQSTRGDTMKCSFTGVSAACILHELDHLLGKTMFDSGGYKL